MAEEITQNTFFKAMTAKKKFEGRFNELSWLCGIAKHLAMDEHRKNAKIYEFDESAESIEEESVDPESEVEDKDTALQIHLILHELQEPYKEVFQLRVFGELSFSLIIGRELKFRKGWRKMNQHSYDKCEIVQDLLPLYYDDACSAVSRQLVEDHMKTCQKCQRTYKELQDTTIDTMIQKESEGVLERHAKKEKNAAYKAGVVIALLLVIPIVITFWVSVSSGGEFIFWSVPTIFGLSVVFLPIIIRKIKLPVALSDKKALITMIWDTMWLYLTIYIICNRSGDVGGMRAGFIVSAVMMSGVWIVFLIIRYLKTNGWIKAGIVTAVTSIWFAFANDVCVFFTEQKKQLTISFVDFSDWENVTCVNANIYMIVLIIGSIASALFIIKGCLSRKKEK